MKYYLKKKISRLYGIGITTLARIYHVYKFPKIQKEFEKKKEIIIKKNANKKIKIAFLVMFKTSFPLRNMFELMIGDDFFDPYIIVIPDIERTNQFRDNTFDDTYLSLINQYPKRVIKGFDKTNNSYYELGEEYPLVVFCNPYEHLAHHYHHVKYFLKKNVLTLYANYGYAVVKFWDNIIKSDFYNEMWKVIIENEMNYSYMKKIQYIHGKNALVIGSPKMDKLHTYKKENKRKTILLCPHHTVWNWNLLNLSNFLSYNETFLELPNLFPEIQFIFRPHPLLFPNLIDHKIWTKQQVDEYINKIQSLPNVKYSTSENYIYEFVNSDAIIHDCASFTAEYLFTKNPCCYLIKTNNQSYDSMIPFGVQCINMHYHANNKQEIIDFIQNVVIKGIDPMKKSREEFVRTKLMFNYPDVSEKILNYLKNELKR